MFLLTRALAFSLLLLSAAYGTGVDFNRDVRPILSEKCYHCHGPDEESRKAKLRLDVRDDALRERDGFRAIVPGQPERSELIVRVRSRDPDEMMPPPKEHHTMTEAECSTLERWIKEGAPYAPHWSFTQPSLPPVPKVSGTSHPVDAFIRAKLIEHKLTPSPLADRHTLIRRLSLDLTGLPPTPEETGSFVDDTAPDAYSRAVDRLLASPHFGERWARMWLDLARYADSSGYGSDFFRLNIWPWRDWVISAFNRNIPFDQFTIEQLAGDLLPSATRDQIVATAFHRNTMTNFEGGTPDEEYRVAAVKDRVATTAQVWMGLTAGCAQCHSHKFDPISMREYYQLYAIFNQTEDADRNDEEPKIPLPTAEEEKRVKELQESITVAESRLKWKTPELQSEFEQWLKQPERDLHWQPLALKTEEARITALTAMRRITGVHIEVPEGLGAGAKPFELREIRISARPVVPKASKARYVRLEHQSGKLLQIAEVQVFAGSENIAPKGKAKQSSTYGGAAAARAIDGNTNGMYDKGSVAHTGDNDQKPWWELDLGSATAIDRVVFWNRTEAAERIKGARLIVLDEARKPVLSRTFDAVPKPDISFDALGTMDAEFGVASAVHSRAGNGPERAIDGDEKSGWIGESNATIAFELKTPLDVGGDAILTFGVSTGPPGSELSALAQLRVSVTSESAPIRVTPAHIRDLRAKQDRTPDQDATLLAYFRPLSKHDTSAQKQLNTARAQLATIKPLAFPVMRELPADKRRETHVLNKGNYLMPGDKVEPGLLAALHPAPEGQIDRLALAKWILSPENPLTARVTVNRFWSQVFGAGLVESEEDFGTQGSLPSHPELLDWLALKFSSPKSEGGLAWDMKAFLKMLVTSETYQQSARTTPELLAADPRNRLLSRYPRRRLGAEEIRDSALAASGLLSRKLGGPSVYPPQPDGLWNVAFNGGQNRYPLSTGEDRYRRGLYTFWRRTMPNPTMLAFDAPSRETCTIRRVPTNTPLQAFVTLNDPVFVECAQALARRVMRDGGDELDQRVRFGLEVVLGRPAEAKQIATLRKLFEEERTRFQRDPAAATALATKPLGPLPSGVDPADVAAWMVVANVLLNLDGFLTRS